MRSELSYLQEFEDEITVSQTLPYLQIQNPPNLSLAQIEQFQPPWGWFIPAEQAQLANLSPTKSFEPLRLFFGEDTNQQREVDGFLIQKVRISIIHRSASIEVQEKTNNGWRYVGSAYQNGQLSKVGELASTDRDNYRLRTRYLVLFLDENNQPLHSIPLRLSMGRGVGGSFSAEVKEFRLEVERAFFQIREEPTKSLSHRAHALTVLELELGLHKGEGKAPFVCPIRRATPIIDRVAQEWVVERRDRKVKLIGKPIQSLLIPKSSETGQLILSLWEEHKGFPTQFHDDLATTSEEMPAPASPPSDLYEAEEDF